MVTRKPCPGAPRPRGKSGDKGRRYPGASSLSPGGSGRQRRTLHRPNSENRLFPEPVRRLSRAKLRKCINCDIAGENLEKPIDNPPPGCYNLIRRRRSGDNGSIAQLGEHLPYKQRVIGSSPVGPTSCESGTHSNGLVAQLVRAPPCHGGGRGFEPHPGRHYLPL